MRSNSKVCTLTNVVIAGDSGEHQHATYNQSEDLGRDNSTRSSGVVPCQMPNLVQYV